MPLLRSLKDLKQIEGGSITITNNASIWLVVVWIKKIALLSAEDERIKRIAKDLKTPEDVFNFARNNVIFRDDPENVQQIRTAINSLRTGIGNCVDYCVLMSALLIDMGIPHKFRFVWYKSPVWWKNFFNRNNWIHIYVVCLDGTILDPVLNQRQDGTENFSNREKGFFNAERKFGGKKELIVFK